MGENLSQSGTSTSALTSPVSGKILGLIVALAVVYLVYLNFVPTDTETFEITDYFYAIGAFACGVASLLVSKRYWGSTVFGKAYLALAIAYFLLFAGDVAYNVIESVLHEDPYPSPADGFFLLFPAFAIFHLVTNIRYFKRDIDIPTKVFIVAIAVGITLSFVYFFYEDTEEANFDFWYGTLFVAIEAPIFALAVLGAMVFRHSVLGTAWLLLAIGIFIFTLADIWYYYIEWFGMYDGNHPVNVLWGLSFMVIVYALIKHQKAI